MKRNKEEIYTAKLLWTFPWLTEDLAVTLVRKLTVQEINYLIATYINWNYEESKVAQEALS